MKVTVWNLQQKTSNWRYLADSAELADWDIVLACEAPPARDRHLLVLERIRAYRLVDCLEATLKERSPERGPLENCPCERRDCSHTWTKRVRGKDIPYQDDHLFSSRRLADVLENCYALPFTDDSPSDHAPIVATFSI